MSITADLANLLGGTAGRVYKTASVPASPAYPYRVVGYAPNAPEIRTLDGSGDPLQRFTVQHFGRTADSVEDVAHDTFETFDGREVFGEVCWQEIASPLYRDPDDSGVVSITHTYRF